MRNSKEKYLLLIGMCAALLPVLLFRDFTPSNELRYLSIADEALRNHTFFTFTNHGLPYADKPPLYLWIVMLCKWLTGAHRMWLLALFSLVPAVVIIRTMDRWVADELDTEERSLARMILLTCGLFLGVAVTLRMDMLMCMFIVLSLRTFWRMMTEPKNRIKNQWLFPIYIFLAVFTKGPVGLLVPLCSTVVFLLLKKRIRQFFRYWGWRTWGVLLGGSFFWFVAVYAEGGKEYLNNLLFHQTIDRAVNSFHHEAPFYYYFISIWYSLLPWVFLIIGLMVASLRRGIVRSDLQRFFLTVALTTFGLLSCISAKLQIYLLPAFPFMVYSAMMALTRFQQSRWLRITVAIPAFLFVLILPVLLYLILGQAMVHLNQVLIYIAAGALTTGGGYALYYLFVKPHKWLKAIRLIATSLLFALFLGGWAMPQINDEIGYANLCHKALELSREKGLQNFYSWRVSRAENMDVYLHQPVQILSEEETSPDSISSPAVLMLRVKDLAHFPGKDARMVGDYAVVALP